MQRLPNCEDIFHRARKQGENYIELSDNFFNKSICLQEQLWSTDWVYCCTEAGNFSRCFPDTAPFILSRLSIWNNLLKQRRMSNNISWHPEIQGQYDGKTWWSFGSAKHRVLIPAAVLSLFDSCDSCECDVCSSCIGIKHQVASQLENMGRFLELFSLNVNFLN